MAGEWYPFGIVDWGSLNGRTYVSTGITINDAINSLMQQFNVFFIERFARKPEIEEKAYFVDMMGKPGLQITEQQLNIAGKGLFEYIIVIGNGNHPHYYRIFGKIEREGILPKWRLSGQLQYIP